MRYFTWKLELVLNILWAIVPTPLLLANSLQATEIACKVDLLWTNIKNKQK